jgi:hypothetical protein
MDSGWKALMPSSFKAEERWRRRIGSLIIGVYFKPRIWQKR